MLKWMHSPRFENSYVIAVGIFEKMCLQLLHIASIIHGDRVCEVRVIFVKVAYLLFHNFHEIKKAVV